MERPETERAIVLRREEVESLAAVGARERRARLPAAAPLAHVPSLHAVVEAVNNGAGVWAREGGLIGNSEVRALEVRRPPTPAEVVHGVDPDTEIVRTGFDALALLFEHASLDVQTEIYRRLDRTRPWWARFDLFGWIRGARAPVERFEEVYEPGGPVEMFVMSHDRGRWLLPSVFRRWFGFTVGKGDWSLGLAEVTGRGGDVEAEDVLDRGYAPSLVQQFEDMAPGHRWRALHALAPDLLDSPVGGALRDVDPAWFDPLRFGVAVLIDPADPVHGVRMRERAEDVRRFVGDRMGINPYRVERGFDLSFIPLGRRFPEIPSEPIHQFAVDLRRRIPAAPGGRLDLMRFAAQMDELFPSWPQLVPEQLHRVRAEDDWARFVAKRIDLWGEARGVRVSRGTVPKRLTYSTRERAGTDEDGRPVYRTRTTSWTADVPTVRVTFAVTGRTGATVPATWARTGDAVAVGHRRHRTIAPAMLTFGGGVEGFHGRLGPELEITM